MRRQQIRRTAFYTAQIQGSFCVSKGQNDLCCSYLFPSESIKDALSGFFFFPELRSMRVLFTHRGGCTCSASRSRISPSVSRKWTWKYTELAVIIWGGLFKFEGKVQEKRQTDKKSRWGTCMRVEQTGLSRECVFMCVCILHCGLMMLSGPICRSEWFEFTSPRQSNCPNH